jgi:hypothetical protein
LASFQSSSVSGSSFTGATPHTDGTLDCKTLSLLMLVLLMSYLSSNNAQASQSGLTSDPALTAMAKNGVNNMIVKGGSFAQYVTGISSTSTFAAALDQFETNLNTVTGKTLFSPGADLPQLTAGSIPWNTWALAVAFGG